MYVVAGDSDPIGVARDHVALIHTYVSFSYQVGIEGNVCFTKPTAVSTLAVDILLRTGSVITEAIFGWPGLGTMSLTAVTQRDYPVIMGVNFIAAVLVLLSNLLADLAYAAADPRIRYQ